jgi:cholesterol transport system auxiliary component
MENRLMAPDRRALLLGLSSLPLAGCGNLLGPGEPSQIYVLKPATPAPANGAPPSGAVNWALQVLIPSATDALDGQRIALSRGDTMLDYYANAVWPDRLPLLVQTALLSAFQDSGRIASVSREQDALFADYTLAIEVRDFSAHYSDPDGAPRVVVMLVCQMAMAHGRKVVANFTASQSTPASANSVPAVVQAMDAALGAALAQITNWALALPPPPPAQPAPSAQP